MDHPGARYRALLIGIDRYPTRPLRGCVNDIDAIQRLLLHDLSVPASRIQRLASPHPDAPHEQTVTAEDATHANIRAAFECLIDAAEHTDRVLIYYSGHGARTLVSHGNERSTHCEALVPVDGHTPDRLLFDFHLNHYLARLTARTRAVTCILDCCHAGGAMRGTEDAPAPRSLDLAEDLGWRMPISLRAGKQPLDIVRRIPDAPIALDGRLTDCQVVAACVNNQFAYESTLDGVRHGRLTRALVHALRDTPRAELHTVSWARIWKQLTQAVDQKETRQTLWMHGHPGRAALAGPPVEGDLGFAVHRTGETYELAAGALTSVTRSTLVAVYGELPRHFPRIGSPKELAARLGLLRVTASTPSTATATADGAAFSIPRGARARIVAAGEGQRLRCGLKPWDDALAAQLRTSPLLEVVRENAEVRLEQRPDHHWVITDDVQGPDPAAALCVLPRGEPSAARELLEHYFAYALPMRLLGAATDDGTLKLRVLSSPPVVRANRAPDVDLPAARMSDDTTYQLAHGAHVCFRVHNAKPAPLLVTLLNPAASGKVNFLGSQIIDGNTSHIFWAQGTVGKPFAMTVPSDKRAALDRLIAVGSTLVDRDLSFLRLERSFMDFFLRDGERGPYRGDAERDAAKDPVLDDGDEYAAQAASAERWTATQVVIRTSHRR